MNIKNTSRLKRAKKTRIKIRVQETPRLTVLDRQSIFMPKFLIALDLKLLFQPQPLKRI